MNQQSSVTVTDQFGITDAALPAVVTPMDMLNTAISRGADIVVLEKLMALYERWEASQARKAFDNAVAAAKGEIPPIVKNRVVDFTTTKGRTNYQFEDLAGIATVIDPILHKHGLSYRHRSEQNGARLKVTCVLSHRDGYSEDTSLEASEDHSGNKNPLQAIGSSASYLQRYTLKLALGLSTTSRDDDGKAASDKPTISDEQIMQIREILEANGRNERLFCKAVKVERLSDLFAHEFDAAMTLIKAKGAKS